VDTQTTVSCVRQCVPGVRRKFRLIWRLLSRFLLGLGRSVSRFPSAPSFGVGSFGGRALNFLRRALRLGYVFENHRHNSGLSVSLRLCEA
jgi:hypothetical protein